MHTVQKMLNKGLISIPFVLICMVLILQSGCGESSDGPAEVASADPPAASTPDSAPERSDSDTPIPDPCDLLRGTDLAALAGVDAGSISYEPGGSTHPYCKAVWPRNVPEKQRQEFEAELDAWTGQFLAAKAAGEPFDGTRPYLAEQNSVLLTVAGVEFASDDAAVQALEGVVGQLADGITVNTDAGSVTFSSSYDEWLDGVGDRAAWRKAPSKLSVAARARMFHLDVMLDEWSGMRPPASARDSISATNQPAAIEMANRIIAEL